MEIQILGPVEVVSDNGVVLIPRRQGKLALGIMALEANKLVLADRLTDLLWGDQAPARARAVLQSRISELRLALSEADMQKSVRLATKPGGYLLEIDPMLVDAHRFRSAVEVANVRSTPQDETAAVLRHALDLWRGPVLGGWLPDSSQEIVSQALESARLSTIERLYEVELELGHNALAAEELLDHALTHPGRERLTELLMLAQHRSGRTAEALQAFDRCRRWLSTELGIDPGSALQDLHLAILRNDQSSTSAAIELQGSSYTSALPTGDFRPRRPETLPPGPIDFIGRRSEVEQLRVVLGRSGSGHTTPLAAICGPGGIGKTALALHVAHLAAPNFPDGQLYADLHGASGAEAADPHQILSRFLRAMGVDAPPTSLDEALDLFRTLTSGRRLLVILDNAYDAEQVLPLIPGSHSSAVLVTSRIRQHLLPASTTIQLDVMDAEDAVELLARVAGPSRVRQEPLATDEIIKLCGQLPLALRVVGGRLAMRPHWTLERMVGVLAHEHNRLDQFRDGGLDVRSSITLSYQGLDQPLQQLLTATGDLQVHELSVWQTAALMNQSLDEAEELLDQLFESQLVGVHGRELTGHARYRMHDLVRLFAQEQAARITGSTEANSARQRAFGGWLAIVETMHRSAYGGDYQTIHGSAPRWTLDRLLTDRLSRHPLAWFETERQSLLAVVRRLAELGATELLWDLACTASPLFQMRRHFDDWETVLDTALASCRANQDIRGEAAILYRQGGLATDRRDHAQARALYIQAKTIFDAIGDLQGQATMAAHLAMLDRFEGDPQAALAGYQTALPGMRDSADHAGEAFVLRGLGQAYQDLDDLERADHYLRQALDTCERHGIHRAAAQARFWLGMLRIRQQRFQAAQEMFAVVLDACTQLGDRPGEVQALRGIGLCYHHMGEKTLAASYLQDAHRRVVQPRPTLLEGFIRKTIEEISKDDRPAEAARDPR
ncbi:BTAD domain-containing putative transcriptional regulator [Hamadaea sp. NPDC050747]|uniref:AfsR/SARP family transcriptional regulator n=1 Tax=Hamadaea sp. NPDC050747 TaxID=3155789 RepID=UPI003404DC11